MADVEEKPAASRRAKKALRVSAPIVTARTANDRIVYLYRGDVLPDDIDGDSVKHLKSLGFLTEDDDVLPA